MRGSKSFNDILLGRAEISNECKNWGKCWERILNGPKFSQVLKKLEKLN